MLAVCKIAQETGKGHVGNTDTSIVEYVVQVNRDSCRLDREFVELQSLYAGQHRHFEDGFSVLLC